MEIPFGICPFGICPFNICPCGICPPEDADADSDLDSPPGAEVNGCLKTGTTWLSGKSNDAELAGKDGGPKWDETGATRKTLVWPELVREAESGCCMNSVKDDPASCSNLKADKQCLQLQLTYGNDVLKFRQRLHMK